MKHKWLSILMIVALTAGLWGLLPVKPAHAAVVLVQSKAPIGVNAASLTVTLDSAPTNGNVLIAAVSTRADSITSITSTNTTWVRAATVRNSGGDMLVEIWYGFVGASAGAAILVDYPGSDKTAMIVTEYSGLRPTSGVLDKTATNTGSSSTISVGPTATTSQPVELWIGALASRQGTETQTDFTNGFSLVAETRSDNTGGNDTNIRLVSRLVSSTGQASTGSTLGNSRQWAAAIATFLAVDPAAVTLATFEAEQVSGHVRVSWETAMEIDNRGFNLYRGTSPAGPDRQLNEFLIPSQGQGSPVGFEYFWDDSADLVPGTTYYYWLEDVDVNGATTMHGPVSVDFVTPTAVTLSGVSASPAAPALPWLWVLAGAGAALGIARVRRGRNAD